MNVGATSSAPIDADNNRFGLLYNQNYPKWQPNYDFSRRIISQDKNKAIRFYITDIDIEDPVKQECSLAFVELNDGVQDPARFCGMTIFQDNYEFISCSNTLSVRYVTGGPNFLESYFRGFRAYYELVDKPLSCLDNGQVTETTTQGVTSTYVPPTYPVSSEVFSTILGTDELMAKAKCVFPFKYQGSMVDKCVRESGSERYWCSTTADYDYDGLKVGHFWFWIFEYVDRSWNVVSYNIAVFFIGFFLPLGIICFSTAGLIKKVKLKNFKILIISTIKI